MSISVRIQKNGKMLSESLCKKNLKFAKTVIHVSSLGRNRLGTKIGKLNKQMSYSTISFGCWTWKASKAMENNTL